MALPKLADIKNWSPLVEKEITKFLKESKEYNFNSKTKKKIYSIDTPPPYINSPVHMGHASTYSFMDMFARYKRMKGFEVLFPLGLDRNGLPIEMGAEKKYKISAFHMSREEFISYCEKLLAETSGESIDTFSDLAISFNSYKEGKEVGSIYLTDSPEYRALTQSTFVDLYKKGLIYEDERINNWDPKLQTTIADSEIEYKEVPSTFNDVIWKVKGVKEEIIIATTRPELICSCGMVIFNPEDKRYKHLEGKTAITPLFGKEVLIKAHPMAQIDKGSGLVMMCSAGDLTDIQFFREQNIKPIISINQNGTMNENAKEFAGLKVKEAREKIIQTLKDKKLLVRQEQIMHKVPVSERSGAEIEFIAMPEFYLKQLEMKEDIRKIIKDINFYPKESKKILDSWLDSVSIDWPISRRRFYATEVPLWHSDNLVALPVKGKYVRPWKEKVPEDAEVYDGKKLIGKAKDFKNKNWIGETRVLDTWFDSSISELYILKYKEDDIFFKKAFPASLRPQGKEIVRTWLYYTILRGYIETKKACFEDVWIHQHITDEKGRKMSKSLGNVIDPKEILKDFGAESLRLWVANEGDLSKTDLSCSKEKIRSELKTLTKLINITKFIMQFEKAGKPKKIFATDKIFLDYMDSITSLADSQYNKYDFFTPAVKLRNFLWEVFASNYLELVKSRAYNHENKFTKEESDSAKYALYVMLERLIQLLHPIAPQITLVISNELNIDLGAFPKYEKKVEETNLVDEIMKFNSEVWKAKRDKNLSLKSEISGIKIPNSLKDVKADLVACHNFV